MTMKTKLIIFSLVLFFSSSAFAVTSDVTIEGKLDINTSVIFRQSTANYTLQWNNPAAARTLTIADPLGNDTLTMNAATQTLTNKTITSTTDIVAADYLKTATGTVDVSAAATPVSGQYLRASSATAALWEYPVTAETTPNGVSTTTYSLTTTANQRVMVWAKGDLVPGAATRTITLQYNAATKDTVVVVETSAGSTRRWPFSLMYTEVPGAATQNITVNTSGGTLANVKIMVLKMNQ
jgi:hypothetical protein